MILRFARNARISPGGSLGPEAASSSRDVEAGYQLIRWEEQPDEPNAVARSCDLAAVVVTVAVDEQWQVELAG